MTWSTKIHGAAAASVCSSKLAEGEDCYTSQFQGGIAQSVSSDTFGSALSLNLDASYGNKVEVKRDSTGLTPINFAPSSDDATDYPINATLKLTLFSYKVTEGPATVTADEKGVDATLAAGHEGKEEIKEGSEVVGTFKPYIEVGRVSPKPKNTLLPPIKSPFAGVPVGLDLPSDFGLKAGLMDIPIGTHLFLNIEGGHGRGGAETGSCDALDECYSLLASARLRFSKSASLMVGVENTTFNASAEPALDLFHDAAGETAVDTAPYTDVPLYAVLQLGLLSLYGGTLTRRTRNAHRDPDGSSDGEIERRRSMTYLAAVTKFGDVSLGLMRGNQSYEVEYIGTRGIDQTEPTEGSLTTFQAAYAFDSGLAISTDLFWQTAHGPGIPAFNNSGVFANLSLALEKVFEY